MQTATATFSDSSNTSTALDGLPDPPQSPEQPSSIRFKTVQDAYNAYKELRQGDQLSALNRARYQMQLDGEPPFSPAELRKYGLATIANVNFGFMEDALTAASAPYEDLVDGAEVLARLPTRFGRDALERQEMQKIMEEEWTAMILADDGFDYQLAELVRQFNLHGTAVPFFENQYELTWRTTETGNFLLPRDVRASTRALDQACCVREYMPHELWQHIEDAKMATEAGWNVPETQQAIKDATPNIQWDDDWDKWQEQWKDNDLGTSYAGRPSVIRVVHHWVRSRDGRVAHLMYRADGRAKDFMFKSPGRFASLGEAFTIFTDGVGTNGKFHGIRGIGYKIYAIVKELNELWSGFLDAIRLSGKLMIQPKSEGAAKNLALVEFGHYVVLPPNAAFQDRQIPNFAQNIIPGLNLLSQLMQGKSGQWTTQGAFNDTKEQTAREIMARVDQLAKLSTTKVKIFYNAWERLLREQVRRTKRKDWVEGDADYDRVRDFYDRCAERGVPKEAIWAIELRHVKAVRAMGGGSPEARTAVYDRLMGMFEQYDAEGKQKLIRGATMAIAGKEMADVLAPSVPGLRPPIDQKIADLENAAMKDGTAQLVQPNEIHHVHLTEHLTGPGGLLEWVQALEAGQVGYEVIPLMRMIHTHCANEDPNQGPVGHLAYIPINLPNGTPNMQRAQFKEALQQSGESIYNGEKHLQKEQQKQEEEAQVNSEGAKAGSELGVTEGKAMEQAEAALMKVQAEAQSRELLTQQELDHNERRFQQEMGIQKAKADADMAAKTLEMAQKAAMEGAKQQQTAEAA